MTYQPSDAAARMNWWFTHLYPDASLDCSTTGQLPEIAETDWWLQGMAASLRAASCATPTVPSEPTDGGAPAWSARPTTGRRFTSQTIGWPRDAGALHGELRDDLIISMRATFQHLHPDAAMDDRTATVLVGVVERSLWLQAAKEHATSVGALRASA